MTTLKMRNVIAVAICLAASAAMLAQTTDVYVGGAHNAQATIWKNGEPEYLTTGAPWASVISVAVENGDVYAAGIERIAGKNVAKVWKNSEELYVLPDETSSGPHLHRSLAVSDGDVYVIGYEWTPSLLGKLWKNGVLETGYSDIGSYPYSVFIDGSDIYVGGATSDWTGAVWKNGDLLYTYAETEVQSCITSIFVYDGDVYAAGGNVEDDSDISKLWKNDELLYTLGTTELRSLYVSDGVIYLTGYDYTENIAKFWVNGVVAPLAEDASTVEYNSMFVFGSDVYVAGSDATGTKAFLWENDELTTLASGGSTFANSVFVTGTTYKVTFAGDEITIAPQNVAAGSHAAQPETPEREGYEFVAWFSDNGTFLNEWTFTTDLVTQDTTLYAKWQEATGIDEITAAQVKIYPNPTTGIINIGQQANIKVYSLQGALLQETFGTQVNLSSYPQGIYQLQVNDETVKVVKK